MLKKIKLFQEFDIALTKSQRFLLRFIVFSSTCFMLAAYSKYYINHLEVYLMVATVVLVLTRGKGMLDRREARKIRALYVVAFIIYFCVEAFIHFEKPSVGVMCELIFGYLLLSLQRQYKIWIFDRFVTLVALLFGLCAIEFILASYLGIGWVDHTPIYRFEHNAHYFYQGILNVFPSYYQTGFGRFQAFTEEPGLVGTLCAFMIACIDTSKYKWQFAVFFLCGVISMSLAFYIMFGLWIIYRLSDAKKIGANIVVLLLIGVVVYFMQEYINEIIGLRLESKTSLSDLDNRGTDAFKKAFNDYIVTSDAFFGRGLRYYHSMDFNSTTGGSGNAGAKPFIYSYGVFSMILLFVFYSRTFLKVNGFNRKALFVLLLFWLSFYQRDVWSTPYNMIPLFIFGYYDTYINLRNSNVSKPVILS